ncbi:MAG: efflux RND transporter permease subunit [Cyanobacteriota bacterium]
MNLTELCIKRPIFATMMIVTLVVLGMASYFFLGVDLYPKVDLPTVVISTVLEGASPEEIESEVTKPLEEEINTISGIDILRSNSKEGTSIIFASFILEKDLDEAVNEVRQKVSASLYKLPEDTQNPVITKVDPDATPVLSILVSGNRPAKEITEIADKVIKRQLQTVEDVGSVNLEGGQLREIQIFIDPNKLYTYNIAIEDVKNAIKKENIEIPAGKLTWELSERGLRTQGRFTSVRDLSELIVANYNNTPIKLKDIGYVEDGIQELRSISRVNRENGIALLVRKQSGSNTIEVVNRVYKKIKQIKESLPPDISLKVVRDHSRFIRKSISEVEHHLILGAIFVSLVVLFFMRDFKASFVACLTIPVSIISTFILMKAMNFTLNNMTLLALTMCTGIVIDDAIIVLENIFRYVEEKGVPPYKAALEATNEIFSAVIATTTSLVVIFLPVAFMSGTVGRFFNSFGFTAAFAIGISLFVALTLIPTLTARLFKDKKTGITKSSKDTFFFKTVDNFYDKALKWSLDHRFTMVFIAILIVLSTPLVFKMVKFDFFPSDDMSEFQVIFQTPPGSSIEETLKVTKELENKLVKLEGIEDIFTTIGSGSSNVTDSSIYAKLVPIKNRRFSQDELMKQARKIMKEYPGLRPSVQMVGTISGGGFRHTKYNTVLQGPDIDKLEEYAKYLIKELAAHKGFVDLDTAQPDVQPEVEVNIDREKASKLGINIFNIASTLRTMVGGEKVSNFKENNEQYDIRLRLKPEFRKSIENVQTLPVRNKNGELTRIENIATITEGKGPSQIDHYNMQREITVIANLENEMTLGEAKNIGDKIIKKMNLPSSYKTYPIGYGKLLDESVYNFLIAALLSIIFIYIVLAAQFESFVQPLVIMSSIPIAIPFGLLSLAIFDQTLNIYSMIGMLLLFGIVKKNAILQVDYTNQLIASGMPLREAVIEADHARLRPILMTTLTIIAGMLPLALGNGDGSGARATMATLIIGGQSLCLVITLLLVPVLYTLSYDLKEFQSKFWNKIHYFFNKKKGKDEQ